MLGDYIWNVICTQVHIGQYVYDSKIIPNIPAMSCSDMMSI